MLSALFLMITLADPIKTLKLENKGIYLTQLNYNRCFLELDGTYIVATKYQVWHWDQSGRLLNRFGQKGSGPGEFQSVGSIYWTGKHYWVIDNRSLRSTLFDSKGQYLSGKKLYFRQFIRMDGKLFALDYSKVNPTIPNYPLTIKEILFTVEDDQIVVKETDDQFYKASARQIGFDMNFKLIWMARVKKDTYMVVNQVEPRMYIFDREIRKMQQGMDILKPHEPRYVDLKLPFYAEPPEKIVRQKTQRSMAVWWHSWTRINYFSKLDGDYVIAYEVPDPEDPANSLQAILRFGSNGKPLLKPLMVDGYCLGTQGSKLYLMREGQEEDTIEYFVDTYDLSVSKEKK